MSPADSVNEPLKEYQVKMLGQLRQLRKKLKEEGVGYGGAGADQEKEKLQKENGELKAEVSKLNYRIVHLLRALDEADAR